MTTNPIDLLPPIERPDRASLFLMKPGQSAIAFGLLVNNLVTALVRANVLPRAAIVEAFNDSLRSKINTDTSLRLLRLWLENFEWQTAALAEPENPQSAAEGQAAAQEVANRIIDRARSYAASLVIEAQAAATGFNLPPATSAEIEQLRQNIQRDAEREKSRILAEAHTEARRIVDEANHGRNKGVDSEPPRAA